MELPDYSKLFIEGRKISSEYGVAILRTYKAGELFIPSGRIVACDAFVSHASPFTTAVPPNSYPVVLSVAHFGDYDQRVAAAMLKLRDAKPIKWEMALNACQDLSSLREGEVFGYGVDSGTGCFMDIEAAQILTKSDNYSDLLMAELDKTYIDTWSWANIPLNPVSKANVIAFSTGFGDGVYASYFGYDEKGDMASLLTDFMLFDDTGVM